MKADSLETILAYHDATKHHFHRYAPGPDGLDWANQPDPFRRYLGAPLVHLEVLEPDEEPVRENLPAPLDRRSLSQLFFDSLAISAWKQAGASRWGLRVNPSSGNLHPTEGYLICGPIVGLGERAGVYHYAAREHGLEMRAELRPDLWHRFVEPFPDQTVFVGLSSVPWREAWKYGERAFRYCHHDAGHALGALVIAAATLGWEARLLDDLADDDLGKLMGLRQHHGGEPEYPDCLLALSPQGAGGNANCISPSMNRPLRNPNPNLNPNPGSWSQRVTARPMGLSIIGEFDDLDWLGRPNRLSRESRDWPMIEEAIAATHKPRTQPLYPVPDGLPPPPLPVSAVARYTRQIIRQRRSAVAMDGVTVMERDTFYEQLSATQPGQGPLAILPWPARVHLALFVHRVKGLTPGLYFLVRHRDRQEELKSAMRDDFDWSTPSGCPPGLPLYRLQEADARQAAGAIACYQDIAAAGCYSLGMLAEFDSPLREWGAWFYPRLYWECGLVGQVLYLEAERAGLRATGIGCFFDDAMHQLLGLASTRYQSLYHFTVGGPIEDRRITTLPAYPRPGV